MTLKNIEETTNFEPKFDENGLIPCITTCTDTGEVLMFAFMNEESLNRSIESKEVHYWSRSRKALWHKGAESGFIQRIIEMRTDCDQDCILVKVKVENRGQKSDSDGTCHTGRKSCFYRKINTDLKVKLDFIDED